MPGGKKETYTIVELALYISSVLPWENEKEKTSLPLTSQFLLPELHPGRKAVVAKAIEAA